MLQLQIIANGINQRMQCVQSECLVVHIHAIDQNKVFVCHNRLIFAAKLHKVPQLQCA